MTCQAKDEHADLLMPTLWRESAPAYNLVGRLALPTSAVRCDLDTECDCELCIYAVLAQRMSAELHIAVAWYCHRFDLLLCRNPSGRQHHIALRRIDRYRRIPHWQAHIVLSQLCCVPQRQNRKCRHYSQDRDQTEWSCPRLFHLYSHSPALAP